MQLFKKDGGMLETLCTGVLFLFLFLLPIFTTFYDRLSFQFEKSLLVIIATIVVFSLFILIVLKKGAITLPRGKRMVLFILVPLVSLISALVASSQSNSLIGYGYEMDTFMFTAILFVLMGLVMMVFRSANKVLYGYLIILLSLTILFAYHVLRFIFGADFLSFGGEFATITATPAGKWSDLAILAGVVVIVASTLFDTVRSIKYVKAFLYVAFALALIVLAVVNFTLVWYAVGLLALISFVYLLTFGSREKRTVSVPALLVLALSAIFIIAGDSIRNTIATMLHINAFDAWPRWSSTFEVAKGSLSGVKNLLLGTGPNTFMYQWEQFKPLVVNQSTLWSTTFNYGISYLATTMVTLGIGGVVAWVAFLGLFLYEGVMATFVRQAKSVLLRQLTLASFVSALFLWSMLLLHVPGMVVLTLAFVFTGLFFATAMLSGILEERDVSFIDSPRIGFVVTLILVFVFIAGISLGYYSLQKTISSVYYQQGLVAGNSEGDIAKAGEKLTDAIQMSQNDVYYQALVDLNLIELNQLLASTNIGNEALTAQIQQVFSIALQNAQQAINANPLNYQNYMKQAQVYASLVPLGVEGAYDSAMASYGIARERSPKNPSIHLAMAQLEIAQGNADAAREEIGKAIELKNNYTSAVFLLAQLEASLGNTSEAIRSVEVATVLEPNNPTLRFQLGLLYYNNDNYSSAVGAFENAVLLAPNYANARYFLGLSYYEVDRAQDAVRQFEIIAEDNPDNEEVSLILGNLRVGNAPFANAEAPIDDEPENRDELPLENDVEEE